MVRQYFVVVCQTQRCKVFMQDIKAIYKRLRKTKPSPPPYNNRKVEEKTV